jgi:hypothetical protein
VDVLSAGPHDARSGGDLREMVEAVEIAFERERRA